MGATNHTPNLKLPQFIGTDKPTWLGDVNNAFSNIDSGFGDLQLTTSSIISTQIKDLQDTVALHTDGILENAKDIAINTASIGAMATHLSVLDADLEALDKRERSHFATLQNNIDLNNKSVQDIADDNVYIKKNMDKIESDVIIATASIAAYKVQVDNLDKKVNTFDSRINDNDTDIANLQAETDVLIQRADTADTDISTLQQKDIVTTSSIANLDSRVTVLETLPGEVADLKQDVDDNTANIVNLDNLTRGHTSAIQNLETKTNGITDGVTVPFGFGIDSSGNRGFLQPDNTVQPFFTDKEWQDLQDDINNNMTDISDLQTKTAGITDGMTLPYSLAIAPGGAYGYKKNGEQGVTPFVTEEDVDKIVDLQPLEADVQTLQTKVEDNTNKISVLGVGMEEDKTDIASLKSKTDPIKDGAGIEINGDHSWLLTNPRGSTMSLGSPTQPKPIVIGPTSSGGVPKGDYFTIPFKFGIDSNGNYGYFKVGADTVTPFKSAPEIRSLTNQQALSNGVLTVDGFISRANIPGYSGGSKITGSFYLFSPPGSALLTGQLYAHANSNIPIFATSISFSEYTVPDTDLIPGLELYGDNMAMSLSSEFNNMINVNGISIKSFLFKSGSANKMYFVHGVLVLYTDDIWKMAIL